MDEKAYLKGGRAKAAYDKVEKTDALCIEWFNEDMTKRLTPEMHTAEGLDQMTEVYVVASDFSWTYIKTHESSYGPYFTELDRST